VTAVPLFVLIGLRTGCSLTPMTWTPPSLRYSPVRCMMWVIGFYHVRLMEPLVMWVLSEGSSTTYPKPCDTIACYKQQRV
jgi:hypothetical protein